MAMAVELIDGNSLQQWLKESRYPLWLIDVRSVEEFQSGYIPGAMNLPMEIVENFLLDYLPERDIPLVIYCEHGKRSSIIADRLSVLGYQTVYSLKNGYAEYKNII